MTKKREEYGNESIQALKGADRVRKRPAVIFGSDGIEGCEHAVFEIISNAIDEARAGYGDKVIVTRYKDGSIEVEDFGRGCPVDWNNNEQRYNWELISASCMPGENTTQTATMNIPSVLTGLVFAPPSIPPNGWMLKFAGTDFCIICILSTAKMSADLKKKQQQEKRPAPKSVGSRTTRFLPM